MPIGTNLKGRLRNTNLPKTHGLLPVYEAVVNSIHSIEEAGLSPEQGKITVEILRSQQQDLELSGEAKRGPDAAKEILGFRITDNGIGFNDENMDSFETLDTEHKIAIGCRGVGRLLWLKAFGQIRVESCYKAENAKYWRRAFSFDKDYGVHKKDVQESEKNRNETSVYLEGFNKRYKEYARKTAGAIANGLFEHCLWYYIREGGAPNIYIIDEGGSINIDTVCQEHMLTSAQSETYDLKGHKFDITHVKFRNNATQYHTIAFCAANRLVKEETINGKIPGLFGRIRENEDEFVYACYVGSDYLNEKVRPERTDFDFEEDIGGMFSEDELTLQEIRQSVLEKAEAFLGSHLEQNKIAGRKRVDDFVAKKAPRYRPILTRIAEEKLSIDPATTDKDLDIVLHKELLEIVFWDGVAFIALM